MVVVSSMVGHKMVSIEILCRAQLYRDKHLGHDRLVGGGLHSIGPHVSIKMYVFVHCGCCGIPLFILQVETCCSWGPWP